VQGVPHLDSLELKGHPHGLVQAHSDPSSGTPSAAVSRLQPIEGLRAYLVLWALAGHAFWAAGYEPEGLSGLPKLVLLTHLPVNLAIIISGFVIFLSLDKQRETYQQFIVRRFFRLFPVFILLVVVAIPLSILALWNVTHAGQYLTSDQIEHLTASIGSWWENIQWHLPLHLLMIHGLVPEILVTEASQAFVQPAWVVSLEWQFYLVAPLAFAWAVSSKPLRRLGLCAVCLALFMAARYVLPNVMHGAALPFHVEYFFLGAASYFIYKRRAAHQLADTAFPMACCLAVFLVWVSSSVWPLVPIGLWVMFLGLLLEQPSSFSFRLVSPLLTNPLVQYLGRISYSMYLSHILVIIVMQYALLTWAPDLSQFVHAGMLLACATAATIVVSAGLYHYLEAPWIHAGRALAYKLVGQGQVGTQEGMSRVPEKVPSSSPF